MLKYKELYDKEDLYKLLSVPEKKRKGPWHTGYTKFDGSYYVFANIGVPGRTGHDYDNHWGGKDLLVWYGKSKSHIGQKSIKEMLSGKVPVHIFTREEDRSKFLYRGLGVPVKYENKKPVLIEWSLMKPVEEIETDEVIKDFILKGEAPDDVIKKVVAVLKRVRDGQKKLKDGLMQIYDGQCCITGSSIAEVLIGCHIEPHKLNGNNQSKNGLLLRADLHILFDTNLIGIEPDTLKVRIGSKLMESEYEYLDGMVLKPRNDGRRPDRQALAERWKVFVNASV
ncbi:DUF3427 domain-containing protein [Chitinophaga sancti]|uniref:HNH endonuclease n=1 Tax=Chitinophaga sancti TaxID=1004 RepID=UPI002A7547DE|nr:DUF3427 domain-containing protein [Chitinophaga sancti]WPQ63412.1 DUF3427 domain-containing protein [Chitinophaga sancti]